MSQRAARSRHERIVALLQPPATCLLAFACFFEAAYAQQPGKGMTRLGSSLVPPPGKPVDRPDVILVILDDVGAKDVELVHAPTIDQLAASGRNFTRGYSMPVCGPARRTLMFAEYAESAGPICQDTSNFQTPRTDWFSLPKPFEALGYETAYLGKWHLGTNDLGEPWESTPQLHGFDDTFAIVPGNVSAECDQFEGHYYRWLAIENGIEYVETRYQTLVLRDKFMQWWTTVRGPRFAVVSFQAAHAPFQEPPPEILPHLPNGGPGYTANRIQFEKLIISADAALSQMLSVVDTKNTYIVLIGDNGTPPNATAPGQFRDKVKATPYEGGIRVPFIVSGPGIVPGDSDSLASVVDILPTLADLLGQTQLTPDGVSLLPVLRDPRADVNEFVFASNARDRAVVQQRYKLIRLQGVERFFDLEEDPLEVAPLDPALIDPGIVASLRKQMSHFIDRGL